MSTAWTLPLDDPAAGDPTTVGGKAAGLHRLLALGVRVPAGFVVTTRAFTDALDDDVRARAEAPLRDLAPDAGDEAVDTATAAVRATMISEGAGSAVLDAVRAAYGGLGGARVAVRSSAVGEDAAGASYAGEHDIFLGVTGAEAVADAVVRCWASLYTARAVSYREHARAAAGAMAVVVQELVPARAAGVFMTLNPANGDRSTVVCEAVWGLGEPLVSGAVTPDRFVLDKVSGEVLRREVTAKPTRMVDGATLADVPAELVERPCLDDAELAALLDVARRVEQDAGVAQDGEFAVAEPGGPDAVHLLQARPETVWSRRPARSATSTGGRGALGAVLATLTRSTTTSEGSTRA